MDLADPPHRWTGLFEQGRKPAVVAEHEEVDLGVALVGERDSLDDHLRRTVAAHGVD